MEMVGAHGTRSKKFMGADKSLPGVEQILGVDTCGDYKRLVKLGYRDYSRANSEGSRGIYCYYYLTQGVYEINERQSWKRTRKYFIRVNDDATITEISREEVEAWLESTTSANQS